MKNGASKHDEIYERMGKKPNYRATVKTWHTMQNYIKFYEDWIRTCASLSKRRDNPNKILLEAWEG